MPKDIIEKLNEKVKIWGYSESFSGGIKARSWEDFLLKLEDEGFLFDDDYFEKPETVLYVSKKGIPYELEVFRHFDGGYEVSKMNTCSLHEENLQDKQYYIRFDAPSGSLLSSLYDLGYDTKTQSSGSLYLRFSSEEARDRAVEELEDHGFGDYFTVGETTREEFVNFFRKNKIKESKTSNIQVPFEIKVSSRGTIGKATMMKVFKQILKAIPNSSRIGRTYFVKDSTGRETCWWLEKNEFGDLELTCELTEDETEVGRDRYNSIVINYDRSTKKYSAEYESHFVETLNSHKFPLMLDSNLEILSIEVDNIEMEGVNTQGDAYGKADIYITFKYIPTKEVWQEKFTGKIEGNYYPHDYPRTLEPSAGWKSLTDLEGEGICEGDPSEEAIEYMLDHLDSYFIDLTYVVENLLEKFKEDTVFQRTQLSPLFYIVKYKGMYAGEDHLEENLEDAKVFNTFGDAAEGVDDLVDSLVLTNEIPVEVQDFIEIEKEDYKDYEQQAKNPSGLIDEYPAKKLLKDRCEIKGIYADRLTE